MRDRKRRVRKSEPLRDPWSTIKKTIIHTVKESQNKKRKIKEHRN